MCASDQGIASFKRQRESTDALALPRVLLKLPRCTAHIRSARSSAGLQTTCAVTTFDQAWCWGDGTAGQLGNGLRAVRTWPRPAGPTRVTA